MADPSKLHAAVLGVGQVLAGEFTQRSTESEKDSAELYRLWIHRLVNINATVAATLSWKLIDLGADTQARRDLERSGVVRKLTPAGRQWIERGDDGYRLPDSVRKATRYHLDDAVVVDAHPIIELLEGANPWTDGYGLLESTYADLQLFGEAYWFAGRSVEGAEPDELWRMMPGRMRPVADRAEFVNGFLYRQAGGDDEPFGVDEVVWFRRYSPDNPYRGVGELEAWKPYAQAADHIAEFNQWLFKRNGTPDHVVISAHPVEEADKRAFRSRFRQLFGKLYRRRETIGFLSGDLRLEKLGQSSRELEFSESSRLVRDFLCAGFGVPKALVTPEDANRAVTKEATDQHLRLTVWPMACRVFDTINEQLVPKFGGRYLVVPDNPIRTDAATRAAERASKLASGWSVNELRVEEGAEQLTMPEADEPMVGGGIKPLAQAVAPPPPPPMPPPPLGMAPDGQDEPQDEPEGEDDAEAGQAEERQQRAASPSPRRCCEDMASQRDAPIILASKAWHDFHAMPPVLDLDELERVSKAAIPDDPEDIRIFASIVRNAMTDLQAILLAASDRTGEPEAIRAILGEKSDDIVRAVTSEAQVGVRQVVSSIGQQAINGLRPGLGIAFNTTNPAVVAYVQASAQRIGETVATTFTDATVSQLQQMIRSGVNPNQAARKLAQTNGTKQFMARRLARTEARFASVAAREQGWQQSGVVEAKQFVLSPNPCDICAAVDTRLDDENPSKRYGLGAPMFGNGFTVQLPPAKSGAPRKPFVMDYLVDGAPGPPIHPNCRCDMVPVLIGE